MTKKKAALVVLIFLIAAIVLIVIFQNQKKSEKWYYIGGACDLYYYEFFDDGTFKLYCVLDKEELFDQGKYSYKAGNKILEITGERSSDTLSYDIKNKTATDFIICESGYPELKTHLYKKAEDIPNYLEARVNYRKLADKDGFCIKDGILYGYIGKAKEVTVPNGVEEIYGNAFSGDFDNGVNLEKVTIPGTVRKIDSYAFAFTEAAYVYIEEGVKVLGKNVFMDAYVSEVHFPASVRKAGDCILETEEGIYNAKIYVVKGSYMEKYLKDNIPCGEPEIISVN